MLTTGLGTGDEALGAESATGDGVLPFGLPLPQVFCGCAPHPWSLGDEVPQPAFPFFEPLSEAGAPQAFSLGGEEPQPVFPFLEPLSEVFAGAPQALSLGGEAPQALSLGGEAPQPLLPFFDPLSEAGLSELGPFCPPLSGQEGFD